MSLTKQQFENIKKISKNDLDLGKIAFQSIKGDNPIKWVEFIIDCLSTVQVDTYSLDWRGFYVYDYLYIFGELSIRFHDSLAYDHIETGNERPTKVSMRYKGMLLFSQNLFDNEEHLRFIRDQIRAALYTLY